MTAPARLRRLDERWVPALAARLQRRLTRWRRRQPSGTTLLRAVARHEPTLAGSIAAVLVAAVLVAALGGDRTGASSRGQSEAPAPKLPLTATIGPAPGTSVSAYLTRASWDLRHYGEIAAARPTFAIVDLRRFETPAEAAITFDGVDVVRAYVRVPSRLPTQLRLVPLVSLRGLSAGLRTAGAEAAATARTYRSLDHLRRYRRQFHRPLAAAQLEARRLSHPATCRCVFAMLVRAGVDRLAALRRLPAVRVVDPASPVVPLAGLVVDPLLPDARTVVPSLFSPAG